MAKMVQDGGTFCSVGLSEYDFISYSYTNICSDFGGTVEQAFQARKMFKTDHPEHTLVDNLDAWFEKQGFK